ncbi:hypothetical protein A5761_15120 [Mycolicibacterium setense]|uniref:HNH endonuclease n=1 Tax=Mycolicibacterium setense TaxID=431269 RepID=UPI0007EA2B88|nr:HNH endonuclease [Mycolicibacterium setense]OBB15070.1 hypothetical protein A5761_15120 [Mycolicibacterium setense]
MAVSKRLRFEILRRDNHTCRYCGGTPPDVILTVDHVIPVSLGGSDDPSNLVAACKDCNAGKTSSNPDAPLVDTVADDALRWAAAMKQAADELAGADDAIESILDAVADAWKPYYKPADWAGSVVTLIKAGLSQDDLLAMVDAAYRKRGIDSNRWSYFCGCCWSRVRQMQDRASAIVAQEASTEPAEPEWRPATWWTKDLVDNFLSSAIRLAEESITAEDIAMIHCDCQESGCCTDPLCVIEYATNLRWFSLMRRNNRERQQRRSDAVIEEAEALLDG